MSEKETNPEVNESSDNAEPTNDLVTEEVDNEIPESATKVYENDFVEVFSPQHRISRSGHINLTHIL